MTAPVRTTAQAAPSVEPSTTVPRGRPSTSRRSRWKTSLVVGGLLLAFVLAMTLLTPAGEGNNEALDPANPGFTGAQALAHVLGERGVKVTVVRSQGELLQQRVDGATTVVVTNTLHLSRRTARTALSHVAAAASLVLLNPDAEVTGGMGLPVEVHRAQPESTTARCEGTDVGKEYRLAKPERAYRPTAQAQRATTCFPDKTNGGGAMVALPGGPERPPVTLLGTDSLITNGTILQSDNAAIALHLFGHTNRTIWYVPSVADIAASDVTSRSIAPDWFEPGLGLAASAVVFLCLWRGRRLGRLVTEPLPVVVRAVETTESRGRMYRRSRDRSRALSVLQLATRKRLAAHLGLPVSSTVSGVAAAAAAVSGRSYQDVLDLLSSSVAHDDSSLLERANTLAALEKEVRKP
jgi:hypothetical protein